MNILLLGPTKQKILKNFRVEEIKNYLIKKKNIVIQSNKKIDINYLNKFKVEFIICNGYPHKISSDIVKNYKNKIVNLHNALLPHGRGVGVNLFCIIKNLPTGISIHYIDKNWDTGPILKTQIINPKKNETFREFYLRLLEKTNEVFIKNWDDIKNNKLKIRKQNAKDIDINSKIRMEAMLDYFGQSYDIKIKDLLKFRDSFLTNEIFFKNF